MRIDLRQESSIRQSRVWLDGRRVERFVDMADDELGEVRFIPCNQMGAEVQIKTEESTWHSPRPGEHRRLVCGGVEFESRLFCPGLGAIPVEVRGEVAIEAL